MKQVVLFLVCFAIAAGVPALALAQEDANAAAGEPLAVKATAYSMPGVTVDGADRAFRVWKDLEDRVEY